MKSNNNFEMKRFFHFNRSWGFLLAVLCGQQERALCCRDTAQASQTRRLPQGSVCLESTRTHAGLLIRLSGRHCWAPSRPSVISCLASERPPTSFTTLLPPVVSRCHSGAPGTTLTARAEPEGPGHLYPPGRP